MQIYDEEITDFYAMNEKELKREYGENADLDEPEFKEYVEDAFEQACAGAEAKEECRYN